MYTNTGSLKAVAGRILLAFATSAVAFYTPQIVEVIIKSAKTGKEKAEELMHKGKKPYAVCERLYDGRIVDTGKRIWK